MNDLTWDNIQKQSDIILSSGLSKLSKQNYFSLIDVKDDSFGNYLISLDKVPFYIGEGKDLNKRLIQQFNPKTSTFYKNFQKHSLSNQYNKLVPIDRFKIQLILTNIGRKEIEEFSIVNLRTMLNKFQLGKRDEYVIADQNGLWDKVQNEHKRLLEEGERKILKLKYTSWFDTNSINFAGLYLVKDKTDNLIYIGESSNISKRIYSHSTRTYISALRRHIGTDILNFHLQEKKGKKRYFSETEDKMITNFLKTCRLAMLPDSFGRYELEEYLIKRNHPLLNRKDNKEV